MENNNFALSPSQIIPVIDHLTSRVDSRGEEKDMNAVFIWGPAGIGKTSIINTISNLRKSRAVTLILSQFDPTDLKGIPVRTDDGRVKWMPTSYLPQQEVTYGIEKSKVLNFDYAKDIAVYGFDDGIEVLRWNDPVLPNKNTIGVKNVTIDNTSKGNWRVDIDAGSYTNDSLVIKYVDKALMFLDELSTADPSVQNAALQLVLDRRVGEYDVPFGVPMIAAGNRECDGAFVQTLSAPLANRFVHLTMKADLDDFIEYGMYANMRPEVLGFVKAFPDCLSTYDPDTLVNGMYGYATPRSLEFLSNQYEDLAYFEKISGSKPAGQYMRLCMFGGIIGVTEASRFIAYLSILQDLPSVHDIVAGKAEPIKNVERSKTFGLLFSIMQQFSLYYTKYYNDDKKPDEQPDEWINARDNIINYITDNFSKEAGSWAGTMMFQKFGMKAHQLRSKSMSRFAKKYADVMTRMIIMSKN